MNKLGLLLIAVALSGPCSAQAASNTQAAPDAVKVTIVGTIKNFDEFAAVVVPNSTYIQLVPLSAKGDFAVTYEVIGGKLAAIYQSDLAKLPVPKTAAFKFTVADLPPGKYFIAAQGLNIDWSDSRSGPLSTFMTNDNTTFTIDIPADAKAPVSIESGELSIRLHRIQ